MVATKFRALVVVSACALIAGTIGAASALAQPGLGSVRSAARQPVTFTVRQVLDGMTLRHSFVLHGRRHRERLTQPDDITRFGRHLFTAFQNGVGPQGQAASDGNTDSTVVEFTMSGKRVQQWDIKGKCDGLTADPAKLRIIATVNEDAHSSIYLIRPFGRRAGQVRHFRYARPLAHHGGTDAISVYHGMVLVSASAPGTTGKAAPQPGYPAVYRVTFDQATGRAKVSPLFFDESRALVANVGPTYGEQVRLALTDPDSNEDVPVLAQRFGGAFVLTSQGDMQQVYVRHAGTRRQRLRLLTLTQSIDDTAWPTDVHGSLYATDHDGDTVDVVTGQFSVGEVLVAVTPCDANNAPSTCPAPGFPANYLGVLDPRTGDITAATVTGATLEPQGLLFVPHSR